MENPSFLNILTKVPLPGKLPDYFTSSPFLLLLDVLDPLLRFSLFFSAPQSHCFLLFARFPFLGQRASAFCLSARRDDSATPSQFSRTLFGELSVLYSFEPNVRLAHLYFWGNVFFDIGGFFPAENAAERSI